MIHEADVRLIPANPWPWAMEAAGDALLVGSVGDLAEAIKLDTCAVRRLGKNSYAINLQQEVSCDVQCREDSKDLKEESGADEPIKSVGSTADLADNELFLPDFHLGHSPPHQPPHYPNEFTLSASQHLSAFILFYADIAMLAAPPNSARTQAPRPVHAACLHHSATPLPAMLEFDSASICPAQIGISKKRLGSIALSSAGNRGITLLVALKSKPGLVNSA
ncbi:hypothetical protein C8R44DRAFT_754905 [Mycena epipterygia]|nr:hypothetical protein C8R44DRAFT_754905 [Mycena epipterygia]